MASLGNKHYLSPSEAIHQRNKVCCTVQPDILTRHKTIIVTQQHEKPRLYVHKNTPLYITLIISPSM